MERICYCPSEDHLEEAEQLAAPWGVHVQMGESDLTKPFEFDREKAQMLVIPTEQHFKVSSAYLKPYETLACNYLDEFTTVENVRLAYDGPQGTTHMEAQLGGDPHYKGWRIRFPCSGRYHVRVFDDDGEIAVEEISVVAW
jgi:hypothetical protein